MIVSKRVNLNRKYYRYTYSDSNLYIRKVGTDEIYENVYDLPSSDYEYEETDREIEDIEDDDTDFGF